MVLDMMELPSYYYTYGRYVAHVSIAVSGTHMSHSIVSARTIYASRSPTRLRKDSYELMAALCSCKSLVPWRTLTHPALTTSHSLRTLLSPG